MTLYEKVKQELLDDIACGTWPPGVALPSEANLAQRFQVSVATIRAAISELVTSHVLVRKQGKGTFVTTYELNRERYHFLNVYNPAGIPVVPQREVISMRKVRPTRREIEILHLQDRCRGNVYKLFAKLKVDEDVVAVMTIILPEWIFEGPDITAFSDSSENIYAIYQAKFGVTVIRMEETVSSNLAGSKVAKHLGSMPSEPCLGLERVSFTFNDIPVEIRQRTFSSTYKFCFKERKLNT